MLKPLLRQTTSWFLAGLLLLSLWLLWPLPVHAGKALKALTWNDTGNSVAVVAIYQTSYAAQKGLLKSLKLPIKQNKKAAGFQGAAMLQSQDGKQVILLSQWQDLASYQAASTPKPSNGLPTPPDPTRTLLFKAATAQTSIVGATPALRGKEAVVQWAQLTPHEAEGRSQVLSQAEAMLAPLLNQQPIPQSILLWQGIDQDAIALMMNWNCSALFEDVGQPGAIPISPELAALADVSQHLYAVTNIIPADLKQPEDVDD